MGVKNEIKDVQRDLEKIHVIAKDLGHYTDVDSQRVHRNQVHIKVLRNILEDMLIRQRKILEYIEYHIIEGS